MKIYKESLVASIIVLFQFGSNSFFVHMRNKFFYMSVVDLVSHHY